MPELGRSGCQFQLSYNLKVIRRSSSETGLGREEWAIRQAALHHQFDVEEVTTLWIVTQSPLILKLRVDELTGIYGKPKDREYTTRSE